VFIGIFQWWWELFPFSMTLFMVLFTHGYSMKFFHRYILVAMRTVYFSRRYSLLNALIINFFYRLIHRLNENSNTLTINALFYRGRRSLTEWEFQALVINAFFFLTIDCLLLYQRNHRWNEKSLVIFGGVYEIFWCELKFQLDFTNIITDENF